MMKEGSTLKVSNLKGVSTEWDENSTKTSSKPSVKLINHFLKYKKTDKIRQEIFLQWAYNQEVVLLPKNDFYNAFGKRLLDVIISSFVVIFILSWLIPLIGSLILTESQGSILFIQKRSGRKSKPFDCLKLRTMYVSNHNTNFQQTVQNDERVTKLGRFLRRTNLDEMPQFINVLLGHMSLVGPRPHAIMHDAQHWMSAAYRERYWVKPGITGLAQVRGARGATTKNQLMEQRVRLDHFYIARRTFTLDMKICLWTLKAMLKGDKNAW